MTVKTGPIRHNFDAFLLRKQKSDYNIMIFKEKLRYKKLYVLSIIEVE